MAKRKHVVQNSSPQFRSFTTTHITSFENLEKSIKERKEALDQAEIQEKILRGKLTGEKIKSSAKKEREHRNTEKKLRALFVQKDRAIEKQDHLKEEMLNAQNDAKKIDHTISLVQKELHLIEHRFDPEGGSSYEQQLEDVQREKERINKELTALYQELQQIMGAIQGTMVHREKHHPATGKGERHDIKLLLDELRRTIPKLKERKEAPLLPQKPIKRIIVAQNPEERKEVGLLLKKIDELLLKLPDSTIKNFAQSADFQLYKKIMGKYNVK